MQERGYEAPGACGVEDTESPDSGKARLLIVEDEGLIALYLTELLDQLGYDVCARATSGDAALEAADRDRPDLAIVDIGLAGGMDGISTARLLRERFEIPSIFLSGTSNAALLARARAVRSPGFIQKPFMPDDIERVVKAAFAHRRAGRLKSREFGGEAGEDVDRGR